MADKSVLDRHLIVGLGNPGPEYRATRHNIGFMIVDLLADRLGVTLNLNKNLLAKVGVTSHSGKSLILVKPMTFMNHSGRAVVSSKNYYKVPLEGILVISDDIALPFGELRKRDSGSSGGHNGLRSIIDSLSTKEFSRLRVGIDSPKQVPLESYVLSPFTQKEQLELPAILEKAANKILEEFESCNK
jgi:PTH1 family peptidyl-tRNA hydrolase